MPTQPQKSNSSSSTTSSRASAPDQLVALPSLSHNLHDLSHAKSVDNVALHRNLMSTQRQAESEAKLRKVLSKSASSNSSLPPAFMTPSPSYSPGSNSPPLMMRKPTKKIAV